VISLAAMPHGRPPHGGRDKVAMSILRTRLKAKISMTCCGPILRLVGVKAGAIIPQ